MAKHLPIGTRWKWMASFTFLLLYLRYPLKRSLGGPQRVSGRCVKENSFSHYIFAEHYRFSALCFTFSSRSLHRSPLYVACKDWLTTCGRVPLTDPRRTAIRKKKILWTQNSAYWGRLFSSKFLHCVSCSEVNFPFVGGKFILISFSILQTTCSSVWGQINVLCLRVHSLFRENPWWSITSILETEFEGMRGLQIQ